MSDLYRTRDLAESAALITSNQRLISIERIGKICWFTFDDLKKCKEISDQFFFGELMVNAQTYHQTIIKLKNRIFAEN